MATTTSCSREIHVGDVGTLIEVTLYDCTTVVDLTGATVTELVFMKPSGTKVTVDAEFKTDGTDGVIQYIVPEAEKETDPPFFDEAGAWKIQGKVTLPTGVWNSDIAKFKVYDNL
jgi:hypothetical protein